MSGGNNGSEVEEGGDVDFGGSQWHDCRQRNVGLKRCRPRTTPDEASVSSRTPKRGGGNGGKDYRRRFQLDQEVGLCYLQTKLKPDIISK